jgi:hypothetical protein
MKPSPHILLMAVLTLAGCSTTKVMTSELAATRPEVDGNTEEWDGSMTRHEDGRVLLGVRNDAERLYVAVRISDAGTVRQAIMTGMELWIDPAAGEDEKAGFRYPMGLINFNRGTREALPLPTGETDPATMEMLFGAQMTDMQMLAKDSPPMRVRVGSIEGLEASSRFVSGTLSYEFSIPLSATGDLDLGLPADLTMLSLGVKTVQLGGGGGRASLGGAGGGGRGGRAGGGGRGGRGGRRGGAPARGPRPIDLWIQVSLAK